VSLREIKVTDGEEINIIVNHYVTLVERKIKSFQSSRSSEQNINSLQRINPMAKVITMGDLNDGLTIKA
jgi:hypothetical protein